MRLSSLVLPSLTLALVALSGCYDQQCDMLQGAEGERQAAPSLRNPGTGQCESFGGGGGGGGGGTTCGDYGGGPVEPAGAADLAPTPDWGVCDGYCESLAEDDCLAAAECRGAYLQTCPPDALCDEVDPQFYQCWAISTGGPTPGECNTFGADECARHNDCIAVHDFAGNQAVGQFLYCADEPGTQPDPGSCVGEVACDALPPECPAGTVPGRIDACWSGYCIPFDQCDALPACTELDENSCVARSDCDALYQGVDCTCNGSDCSCADWIYESCEGAQP